LDAGSSVFRERDDQLKICLLSIQEVARLINYGELPRCNEHHHLPFFDALRGIRNDEFVSVGEEFGLAAVTEQSSNNRTWRGRSSEGYQVMQLVRIQKGQP
jgi:hypothetical protein